ncbi:MAG: hypothetical protein ACXWPI_06370 [Ktedonobacterales bacterium]
MRGRITLVGVVAITLIIVVAFGATAYLARGGRVWAFSRGVPSPVAVVCPGRRYTTNGLPIIHPRNTCTPSFTKQDVRDYVSHNPHALFGRIVVEGTPTITSITFTTIRDLSRISGDSTYTANYPADMVACVVELSGTFIGDGGPVFSTTTTASKPSPLAFSLLDAHTGNELMEGLGGSPLA